MPDFRNLIVWQRAHELTLRVYRDTNRFPEDERFGITIQLRRGCASIAANIAEGSAKSSDAEFRRYLKIAAGSASEVDYHILLAHDLGFLPQPEFERLSGLVSEVRRLLWSFTQRLRLATKRY